MDEIECQLRLVFYDRLQFFPPDEPPPTIAVDNSTSLLSFSLNKDCEEGTHQIRVRISVLLYCLGLLLLPPPAGIAIRRVCLLVRSFVF